VNQRTVIVATAQLLLLSLVPLSFGEVVYDSLPYTIGGMGINQVGTTGDQVGQSVRLSGVARQVSQFEVGLGGGGAGAFRIRFYDLDGTGQVPGSTIWESPIQIYPYDLPFYNEKVVTVSVPGITVPDTFAWAVLSVPPEGNMTVLSSNPPTVGQSSDSWFRRSGMNWVVLPINSGVYGARINAVPEPSTLFLLAIGAVSLLTYRRSK
jgi:hypothetical protein